MKLLIQHTKRMMKLLYLLFLLVMLHGFQGLNAQTAQTYFGYYGSMDLASWMKSDTAGNIYFAGNVNSVYKFSLNKLSRSGLYSNIFSSSNEESLVEYNYVVDQTGNVYYPYYQNSNSRYVIKRYSATGNQALLAMYDGVYPSNLNVDGAGNLWVTLYNFDIGSTQIDKISPAGIKSIQAISSNYVGYLGTANNGYSYFAEFNSNYTQAIVYKKGPAMDSQVVYNGSRYINYYAFSSSGDVALDLYNFYTGDEQLIWIHPDGHTDTLTNNDAFINQIFFGAHSNLYYSGYAIASNQKFLNKADSAGNIDRLLTIPGSDQVYSIQESRQGNLYFVQNTPSQTYIFKISTSGVQTELYSSASNLYPDMVVSPQEDVIISNNPSRKLLIIGNPANNCPGPQPPQRTVIPFCSGSEVKLNTDGIGELSWYDTPTGGNVLYTGNGTNIGNLAQAAVYYAETSACGLTSERKMITFTPTDAPVISISGDSVGRDYVSLTAGGGYSYKWSGGIASDSATNVFTTSGNYKVTVENAPGCQSNRFITIAVTRYGINASGELTNAENAQVTPYGSIGGNLRVSKHGRASSTIFGNGMLNYAFYTNTGGCPESESELNDLFSVSVQQDTGTANASLILDWTSASELTSDGFNVPGDNGDHFALEVWGYFVPQETGQYTFTCEGDDAVDLFIGGDRIANHYGCKPPSSLGTHTGTVNLQAGTRYTFKARFQENEGGEAFRVFWKKPSQYMSANWSIDPDELAHQ